MTIIISIFAVIGLLATLLVGLSVYLHMVVEDDE